MKHETNDCLTFQAVRTYSYVLLPPPTIKILSVNFYFKTVRNFCNSNLQRIIQSFREYSASGDRLSKTLRYCNTKALPPDGFHIRYFDETQTAS
jgi:hypothetical protein